MLFINHQDRPGLIGAVGTITGGKDINISFMEVGRLAPRGLATMIFGLDDPMPDSALKEILSIPYVSSAKVIKI
jgi:D-3-phosphoglycerate dehydrogenase